MKIYLLDTDTLSRHQREPTRFVARIQQHSLDQIAISIITAEEQLRGRLAKIRQAKTESERQEGYYWLVKTLYWLGQYRIQPYDAPASQAYESLCRQKLRIGTQDLRIAAIAFSLNATVVTSNLKDFGQIAGLQIEDWTK